MEEDPLTSAEIDAIFAATQPIGDAIREHVEAGLAATTTDSGTETTELLGRIIQIVVSAAGGYAAGL